MILNTKYFEEKLNKEKKLIEKELKNLGILDKKTGDWGAIPEKEERQPDDNDAADRMEYFGEKTYTLGELEIKLQKVNNALKKIEEEKYGICEICEKQIEVKRIEADPTATTCMEHMEK